MPLSEHEQRLLEQMERALSADDPKFANAMRGSRQGRAARRRLLVGIAAVVVGLVLLVIAASNGQTWLGAASFVVMLAGAVWALSPTKSAPDSRMPTAPAAGTARPTPRPTRSRPGGSFMKRLEQRWDRRRNQW